MPIKGRPLIGIIMYVYSLYNEGIRNPAALSSKHSVCVCLNGIRADLHTVVFFRCS